MAPFGTASPLLSPTVRGPGAGEPCTLRPPRLTGDADSILRASSPPPPAPPEDIPCDVPQVANLLQMRALPHPQLIFRGCGTVAKEWKSWVKSMAQEDKFVKVWRAAGIEDAIMNSTVHIRQSSKMMLALVGFWCPSTCTFVLPWGEVGFTLEDAHILGNLPIWGSPLQRLLTQEEERLRLRLVEARERLWKMQKKSGLKARVTQSCWLDWFLNLEGDDELQHLGFLAYWLSKCVVASEPLYEVSSVIFGIAARLCRGERIALAPAVTANIYCDLTTITKSLYSCQGTKGGITIEVWAQFRLVQAWLWERFECLRPDMENSVNPQSRVRIARWDNKHNRMAYREAVKAFYNSESFAWRPYKNGAENWVKPRWYTAEEQSIVVEEHSPIWVYDVLAIISAAGLMGMASEETIPMGQYKPYRVSMQLGYDQAIPSSSGLLVTPWDSCTMCPVGIEFCIPSINKECSTLRGYEQWWEEYTVCYRKVLKEEDSKKHTSKRRRRRRRSGSNKEDASDHISKDVNAKNRLQQDAGVEDERVHQNEEISNLSKEYAFSPRYLAMNVADSEDASEEDEFKDILQEGNAKKRRFGNDTRVEQDANNENISKSPFKNHNIDEEKILANNIKFENKNVQAGEFSFVEKHNKLSRRLIMKDSDDEDHSATIVHDKQEVSIKPKDEEHGPELDKCDVDESDSDDALCDELERFLTQGLQAELMSKVTSLSSCDSGERYTAHDNMNKQDVGDCIAEEMIRRYPKFFNMIPQCPHYLGLLGSNVGAGMKNIVYTSLWCKLVELMQKAIETTCLTRPSEIEQLCKEARYLKELGFDVRHLIACLKQPGRRLKRLELAKNALERVREEAEKLSSLPNISRIDASNLWKAVKDAEINVLEKEWDVKILTKCFNAK